MSQYRYLFFNFHFQQNEFADVWNTNSDMLRSLGKGSLHLVMEAQQGRRGDKQRFVGNITVKATCNCMSLCFFFFRSCIHFFTLFVI